MWVGKDLCTFLINDITYTCCYQLPCLVMHRPLHYSHYPHPMTRMCKIQQHIDNINIYTKSFSLASSNNKEIAWPDAILVAVESDPSKVCRTENCL